MNIEESLPDHIQSDPPDEDDQAESPEEESVDFPKGVRIASPQLVIDQIEAEQRRWGNHKPKGGVIANGMGNRRLGDLLESFLKMDEQKISSKQGTQAFFVSKKDVENAKEGGLFRLRNAYAVKLNQKSELKYNAQYVGMGKLENVNPISWVVGGKDVEITLPDATLLHGIASEKMGHMKENEEVYLDNFGYCRVDNVQSKVVQLWFTHP